MNTYSPRWAPHVKGAYEDRIDPETSLPKDEFKWSVTCEQCGCNWQGLCNSGFVRTHINNFALAHTHKDAFNA